MLSYMDASRVASEFLKFRLAVMTAVLYPACLRRSDRSPPLALMVMREVGAHLRRWASHEAALDNIQHYPTRGPTASPSLHRLDSRTLCGFHSYGLSQVVDLAACASALQPLGGVLFHSDRYARPWATSAQAVRAILLANATTAT